MSETQGNRWYDNTRIIWALFGLIGVMLGAMSAVVWGQVAAAQSEVQRLQVRQAEWGVTAQEILRRLERIERKVDER